VEDKREAKIWKLMTLQINACQAGAFPKIVEEVDEDESSHMNTEETDEEAQDTCLAFDNNLDSEVDDFTIEEDDRVFMTMVHPVNPHHFVCALSTVSGHLVEAFAKNSKPKGFEDIVPTTLHEYANDFSQTAFDSLPQMGPRHRAGARTLTWIPKSLPNDSDRADGDGCLLRGSTGHWMYQAVKVPSWSSCLLHQEER
jgi:hypothetical protein